ncbi:MAG: hypothetical protein AAFN66_00415, partial [Pseudomonadota bacterium]
EHRPYKARVTGSSPVASTIPLNISQSLETQQSNSVLSRCHVKAFWLLLHQIQQSLSITSTEIQLRAASIMR